MVATYNAGSGDSDRVRLLIYDTDVDNAIFSDAEISQFLSLEEDDVRLAAALALETMASREAIVQKVITLMDLSTNGPAVAKELRERAKDLRMQSAEGVATVAEMINTSFQERERLWKQRQRGIL